jgi:lysophospholipase L1-like esterase
MKIRNLTRMFVAAAISAFVALPASSASAYSNYVALGDSVAAGAGLGANLDTICDRSSAAYPALLAQSLGTSVNNLACSGAKVDEGIYGSQVRGGTSLSPQIDAAYANGKPDLITITIGANDVRWQGFVRDCYVWECGSSLDKARAVVYRADLRYELYMALKRIDQLSGKTEPTVLVNGYYNPIPKSDCDVTSEISATEAAWLGEQKNYLNQSIRTTASYFDFARYVPSNFGGHKLCSAESWVQGPNDVAPLHPNAAGHQALARANLKVLTR